MTTALSMTDEAAGRSEHEGGRRGLPTIALVPLAAAVWWLLGFLWWIIQLFGSNIMTVNGYPRAALPLLAASSTESLIVSCGIGGILAGLVSLLGRGGRAARLSAVVAGVALAVAATLVQSRGAFAAGGIDAQTTDPRLTGGLSVLVAGVSLVAVVLGASSLAGRPGMGLALAAAAGAVPIWLFQVVRSVSDAAVFSGSVEAPARWSGAVLLVVALVTIGVRPLTRLAWWPLAVVLAWLVAPSTTASLYFAMSLSRGPRSAAFVREYLSAAGQVWRQAIQPGHDQPVGPWITAIAAAAVLAWVLDRRRPRDQQVDGEDVAPPLDPGPPTVVAPPSESAQSGTSAAAWP